MTITTKHLEEKLDEEIGNRKELESRFEDLLKDYNNLTVNLKKDLIRRKNKDDLIDKKFDVKIEKIENIKEQILTYTFQSVTIVIGILSIILGIVFLYLNVNNLSNEFFGLFASVILFFAGILVLWFILWIKNN